MQWLDRCSTQREGQGWGPSRWLAPTRSRIQFWPRIHFVSVTCLRDRNDHSWGTQSITHKASQSLVDQWTSLWSSRGQVQKRTRKAIRYAVSQTLAPVLWLPSADAVVGRWNASEARRTVCWSCRCRAPSITHGRVFRDGQPTSCPILAWANCASPSESGSTQTHAYNCSLARVPRPRQGADRYWQRNRDGAQDSQRRSFRLRIRQQHEATEELRRRRRRRRSVRVRKDWDKRDAIYARPMSTIPPFEIQQFAYFF